MKKDVFHEGRQSKTLSLTELLLAAGAGGVPAGKHRLHQLAICLFRRRCLTNDSAYLTTPFDVASEFLQLSITTNPATS